jgi:CheY-like chemotaxis protein
MELVCTKTTTMSTLYIIEDSEIDQYIVKYILRKNPLFENVAYFSGGMPALEAIRENAKDVTNLPDAILLDLNTFGLNGWDFLRALQKLYPALVKKIPVYIVTASVFPKDRDKARQYQFVKDFISKPFTKNNLVSIVNSLQTEQGMKAC